MREGITEAFLDTSVPDADCPVALAVQTIGGKWMRVLRSLLRHGPQRYNRLLELVVGVSAKELTRDRELEASGLLVRDGARRGQSIYGLTPVGAQLMPVFRDLKPFGESLQALQARDRLGVAGADPASVRFRNQRTTRAVNACRSDSSARGPPRRWGPAG